MNVFIDSNILIYAYDSDADKKHQVANFLIQKIWDSGDFPYISIQVLQETHVNLIKKGASHEISAKRISRYLRWNLIDNDKNVFEKALFNQQHWQLSFWDASIIAAAQTANVKTLWTEDLNIGQDFNGVRIVNPLVKENDQLEGV